MKQSLTKLTMIKVMRANSRIGLLEGKHAAEALDKTFNVVQAVNSHDVLVSALTACTTLKASKREGYLKEHEQASEALKVAGVK